MYYYLKLAKSDTGKIKAANLDPRQQWSLVVQDSTMDSKREL